MAKTLYTAKATSKGGRGGHVETDDKRLSFDLTPFTSTTGTNPEQLFASGWSACFGSALDAVAKKDGIALNDASVTVEATISQDDHGGYFLSAVIDVKLSLDQAQATQLVQKAHHVCPYSKATRGNIDVQLKANGEAI